MQLFKLFTSTTGYAKNLATGEVFPAERIYLGIFDSPDNYEEATEEECKAYEAKREREMEAERLAESRGEAL